VGISGRVDRNGNKTCSILPINEHDDKKRCKRE